MYTFLTTFGLTMMHNLYGIHSILGIRNFPVHSILGFLPLTMTPNPKLNPDPAGIVFRPFSSFVFTGFVQRSGVGGAS